MSLMKRLVRFYKNKTANRNYDTKIKFLREQGAQIGEKTRLICDVGSFGSEPYLVSLGENCLIAAGVHFFTHDGGVKVLSDLGYFGSERMDIIAPVTVGNNVYIGSGACILPGVTIGDNVVIGAQAVVTGDIPSNSVAVGIPARVIKTIDQYYEDAKRKGNMYPTARMSVEEKRNYYQKKFSNR